MRRARRAAAVLLVSALIAGAVATALPARAQSESQLSGTPFLVGTATANADYKERLCLGGYGSFCNRPSELIKDPLTTGAIAITGSNDETIVIVKTTAIGLFAAYKPEQGATGIYDIRQRIARQTGVPAGNVIVTSDHSHAAPDTIGIWGGVRRAYMELLANSAVKAGRDAYRARQPASLSVAAVDATEHGYRLQSSYSAAPTNDDAMDNEFRVLFADDATGNPLATLVNYAPHATVCGDCDEPDGQFRATGDWTAWAAQEVERRGLGTGIGFIGALGSTDWRKSGSQDAKEAEARGRINALLDAALQQRRPVEGSIVDAQVTFINETLAQPVLLANHIPAGVLRCPFAPQGACDDGDVRIDRNTSPPWITGDLIGTYVGALRIGDVFMSTIPGEPFPQIQDALRAGVTGASAHFMLGGANDFLGYMVNNDDQYRQTLEEGALFLPSCPEELVTNQEQFPAGNKDGACPDHWTLMVSPTVGAHAVCTAQDGAAAIGFGIGTRGDRCDALTALDGQNAPAEHPGGNVSRAGAASVDASWHIGASGGQFSSEAPPVSPDGTDPHLHSTKKQSSYGLGSRSDVRALVVEDAEGEKVAIVSHDLYLPNDLLTRRIATLVEERTGIPASNVMVTASHNHNSAFYSTPSWGTWIFQDVFDLRYYEYMADRSADAVERAVQALVPVRMGGSTSTFNEITSHTYGPKVADDGTPAGQPYDHTTGELTVVAFDHAETHEPVATWVVFGVHPEWTWGYDLINGDISRATTRIVDREVGGVTVWSGREIGASGPHKDRRVHEPEERREYQDNGFAQLDRAARMISTAIADTRADVGAGTPEMPNRYAPYEEGFDVDAVSQRFAPPSTRPYPGVSNCNTASLFHGDPRVPVLGLPDCAGPDDTPEIGDQLGEVTRPLGEALAEYTAPLYDELKKAGVPVPESYSASALTGVEETAAVHLQAIRFGDIGITVCPCEQFTDTALNIESRIDKAAENLWLGFNWADEETPSGRDWCVPDTEEQTPETMWTCANPQNPTEDLAPIDDITYRRFNAQITNDAAGWEDDLATLGSEAEPYEPDAIKGNFTHEEFPDHGFALPISVGMGNDYWGYVPEYREMRSHDHYRKALNGLGLHGADFLATRLARLAVSLNGGPEPELRPIDTAYQAESARAQVVADGLGELAREYEAYYRATLPADGGQPGITSQPTEVPLFSAAELKWVGGSTYADMPDVVVQRRVDGEWVDHANTDGEVQLTVRFPTPDELPTWRSGGFEWEWTATFEAFGSDVTLPDLSGVGRDRTPFGTYRFVVEGDRRTASSVPEALDRYRLESAPFEVVPWDGITVSDGRLEAGAVSFAVGPSHTDPNGAFVGPIDLPDTYTSPFRFINAERRVFTYGLSDPSRHQVYCRFCSFRPWADAAEVQTATVTVERAGGVSEQVPARLSGGRLVADVALYEGDEAFIAAGGVVDTFGDVNGSPSERVQGSGPRPTPTPTVTPTEEPTPTPTETVPAATTTEFTDASAEAGQYSDEATFEARLTDASGAALEGETLAFEITGAAGAESFEARTDQDGLARITTRMDGAPGSYAVTASFAGTEDHASSADVASFVLEREDTALSLQIQGKGSKSTLVARLTDADSDGSGVAGAAIAFFADGESLGEAQTNDGGRATFELPARYRGGHHDYRARFDGDAYYLGAEGTASS